MKHQMRRSCTCLNVTNVPCLVNLLLNRWCYFVRCQANFIIRSGGSQSFLQIIWMFSTCIRKWIALPTVPGYPAVVQVGTGLDAPVQFETRPKTRAAVSWRVVIRTGHKPAVLRPGWNWTGHKPAVLRPGWNRTGVPTLQFPQLWLQLII